VSARTLCIVAMGADTYGVLAGDAAVAFVGGEAVQQVLLARAWRDLGIEVSMVLPDSPRPGEHLVNGIRIIPAFRSAAGIPVLRFLHPRLTGTFSALRRADADIYYQSPAGAATGFVAHFCRRHGRQFIFRVASDANCIPGQQLIRLWRDRKLFEYGMRRATVIAAQTQHQQDLLRRNFRLDSRLINMVAEPALLPEPNAQDIDVLWVGSFRPVKRPEALVELARHLPALRFALVGGSSADMTGYFDRVTAAARQLPNLTIYGAVPYQQVGALFDRARVLANTSTMEGFPNTFLQAWMRGIPVATTFDPDGLVRRHRLGAAATSPAELAPVIATLVADAAARRAEAGRIRAYALREFSAAAIARQYLELLPD
jgi:glycosyltransferase involved in cell wall biosynthesis